MKLNAYNGSILGLHSILINDIIFAQRGFSASVSAVSLRVFLELRVKDSGFYIAICSGLTTLLQIVYTTYILPSIQVYNTF